MLSSSYISGGIYTSEGAVDGGKLTLPSTATSDILASDFSFEYLQWSHTPITLDIHNDGLASSIK